MKTENPLDRWSTAEYQAALEARLAANGFRTPGNYAGSDAEILRRSLKEVDAFFVKAEGGR